MASFADIFDEIYGKFSPEEIAKFKDREELVKLVHSKASQVKSFNDTITKSREKTLQKELCLLFKEKAKKTFIDRNVELALELYTKLIEICYDCNEDPTELLYTAHSGRSLVLYKVGAYNICLQDIEAALTFSEKPEAEYLLYDREARSYLGKHNMKKAQKCFEKALAASKRAEILPQMQELFETQVNKAIEETKRTQEEPEQKETSVFEKSLDCIENNTETCYEPHLGRFVRATRDIRPGEVVKYEDPLLSFTQCDETTKSSKVCHHCMQPLYKMVAFPSPEVKGILFCSWRCQQVATRSYHRHEAYILRDYIGKLVEGEAPVLSSGNIFLAFKAFLMLPGEFYLGKKAREIARKRDEAFDFRNCKGKLNKDELHLKFLCNLVSHEANLKREERVRLAIRSAVLCKCIRETGFFPAKATEQDLCFATELLFRFQLSIPYNVHSVYRVGGDISGSIPLTQVGAGIYPDSILLNHSCAGNTTRFFVGNKILLVAKRAIAKGEEVTNNYGIHHEQMPTGKRKERLKCDYVFECACEACERDYPVLAGIEDKLSKSAGKQMDKLLTSYQRAFQEGDVMRARTDCELYLTKLHTAKVPYPHKNYVIGSIALNSCWWALIGNQMDENLQESVLLK